ncbi:hypothetical protein API480_22 [Paenibacillus phage vB_PlaP_API480]|nr:hypothetical protein API480_22 [Paenibacillus phage vB_PlaP_API480]
MSQLNYTHTKLSGKKLAEVSNGYDETDMTYMGSEVYKTSLDKYYAIHKWNEYAKPPEGTILIERKTSFVGYQPLTKEQAEEILAKKAAQ